MFGFCCAESGRDQEKEVFVAATAAQEHAVDDREPMLESRARVLQEEAIEPQDKGPDPADLVYKEFEVLIHKTPEGTKLGLVLSRSNSGFAGVTAVREGTLVDKWNKANPDKKVAVGDAIIAANGNRGMQSIIDTIKNDDEVILVVGRVREFVARVDKNDGPLGINFVDSNETALKEISRGPVDAYNQTCEAGRMICPTDILLEVNGTKGGKQELTAMLAQATGVIELRFRHAH